MRVLLVSTNRCTSPMRVMPHGACRVAEAAERAGHGVELLDLMFENQPVRALRRRLDDLAPEVVGLSIRNVDNADLAAPVEHCRFPRILEAIQDHTVVIGGPAVSVFPEALLKRTGADWAVVGEGERAFPRLLSALEAGYSPSDIPGVAHLSPDGLELAPPAHDCPPDAPVLPHYDRWLDLDRYARAGATVPIQSSRGCPENCVYCTYPELEGSRHRLAQPGRIAEAVDWLAERGIRDVEFVDNVFNSPPGHAERICQELARLDADVRLHTADLSPAHLDEPLPDLLEQAGFAGVGISAESACDAPLEGLGKSYDAGDVRRAARLLGQSDLPTMWFYLLGGPCETRRTVRETLAFARRSLGPRDAATFFAGVRIYPGTPLEDIARREGQLTVPAEDMLEPVFYVSPAVGRGWLLDTVEERARRVPGFIGPSFRTSALASAAPRMAELLDLEQPAWQHTSRVRRTLAHLGL